MSEFGAPRERHEPRDMTVHLDMYWADCEYTDDSPVAMLASLERLIQNELGLSAEEANQLPQALDRARVVPSYRQFEESPEEVRELFSLAPLRFLAPYMEMTCTPTELRKWYARAVHIALTLSEEHTNEACLDLSDDTSQPTFAPNCAMSDICPRRYLRVFLTDPLYQMPSFDASVTFDPEAYFELSDIKLKLAIRHGLVTKEHAEMLSRLNKARRARYQERPFETE